MCISFVESVGHQRIAPNYLTKKALAETEREIEREE